MWQKERDLLIAQTMAFVQSVAGKPADTDSRHESRARSASPDQRPTPERPADILPVTRLSPLDHNDLRDDIRRRVAAFRARQQAFDRDRIEYCDAMMAKARATTERVATALDSRQLKR